MIHREQTARRSISKSFGLPRPGEVTVTDNPTNAELRNIGPITGYCTSLCGFFCDSQLCSRSVWMVRNGETFFYFSHATLLLRLTVIV